MQKITKASQVIWGEWYWVGNVPVRSFKRGRWVYFKSPHWVDAETVNHVLREGRIYVYGPIPRPPEAERNGKD